MGHDINAVAFLLLVGSGVCVILWGLLTAAVNAVRTLWRK